MTKVYPKLYKEDTKGGIRVWWTEQDGDKYRTHAGVDGGKMVVSEWTVAVQKQGSSSAEAQATREIEADYKKKRARHYYDSIDDLAGHMFFVPMLAQKFDAAKIKFPVYSQPKLDGIRCIATQDGLWSREGKQFFGVPHIEAALKKYFDDEPNLVIDGELYSDAFSDDFNQVIHLVKQNPAINGSQKIEYHIYDSGIPGTFLKRYLKVKTLDLQKPLVLVETHLCGDQDALDELMVQYINDGREGQIVRLDGEYEHKRSKNLLKRKDFHDHEFPISDIIEGLGNWSGVAKAVEFIMPGDLRTLSGERPKAGIKGSRATAAKLLQNKDKYKTVTVRYFNLTPAGIPRFPVAVAFYEGKRDV